MAEVVLNLTPAQLRMLAALNDGYGHSLDWLADKLGYTGGRSYLTVSRPLLTLIAAGLAGIEEYNGDVWSGVEYVHRNAHYKLTAAGMAAIVTQAGGAAVIRCDACGQPVIVAGSNDGTLHYEPVTPPVTEDRCVVCDGDMEWQKRGQP